jgi:flagellar assembly protein FliH
VGRGAWARVGNTRRIVPRSCPGPRPQAPRSCLLMNDRVMLAPRESVAAWDLPSITGSNTVQSRRPGRTVAELEAVEQRAYQEAYAAGREAGLLSVQAETQKATDQLKAQVARLEQVLGSLAQPLLDVDAEVEEQLVSLALTIAKQLVRRELKIEPAQVIAVVRETVALLPTAARDVRVHLHPEDANVVRERLSMPGGNERAWTIVEDPVMMRGGCRVTTDTAQIDARLETRINAVVSNMLGDQRARNDDARVVQS